MVNVTLPDITDYLNDNPVNFGYMFVDPWLNLFGSYFWGILIIIIGVLIMIKTENTWSMVAWFMVATALGATIFPSWLLYFLGLIAGVSTGFLLYKLFMSDKK